MSEICHLRCDTCKSQVTQNTLGECLDEIKCLLDNGPLDDTCKIALKADGKSVYTIHQEIPNTYKGKTDTSGVVKKSESVKDSGFKKTK